MDVFIITHDDLMIESFDAQSLAYSAPCVDDPMDAVELLGTCAQSLEDAAVKGEVFRLQRVTGTTVTTIVEITEAEYDVAIEVTEFFDNIGQAIKYGEE